MVNPAPKIGETYYVVTPNIRPTSVRAVVCEGYDATGGILWHSETSAAQIWFDNIDDAHHYIEERLCPQ